MNELNKIIVADVDGKEHEFKGGSGEGSRPGPNTVGSAEIEDESIEKQDLHKDIQDKLDLLEDSNVVTEEELENGWEEAMRQAGLTLDAGSGQGQAGNGGAESE